MFAKKLISWYQQNKRDLPWRNTRNPYKIWLSEIILQQTRVEQGLPYYQKFVSAFPTINSLAEAKEDEVLKLWQGLGYYSRARNLHHAAKSVALTYKGVFPKIYEEVLALKGVGEYTAAAITSFAYLQPYPVLDGNVFRVISRIYGFHEAIDSGPGKKKFIEHLRTLIPHNDPATFNQAIMEFGAMHCLPKNPLCDNCIFNGTCYALQNNKIDLLPVKEKKLIKKNRHFYYKVSIDPKNRVLIQKRSEKDIWQGLYEFPYIESSTAIEQPLKDLELTQKEMLYFSEPKKHLLTHQNIYFSFYIAKTEACTKEQLWVSAAQLADYPVPKIIADFISKKLNLYLPRK